MLIDARLWSKIQPDGECWIWTAAKKTDGYGMFKQDGRTYLAHRLVYELLVSEIPAGLQLDHHKYGARAEFRAVRRCEDEVLNW